MQPDSGEHIQLVPLSDHLGPRTHEGLALPTHPPVETGAGAGGRLAQSATWRQQDWGEEESSLAQRVPGELKGRKKKSCDERHRRKKRQSFPSLKAGMAVSRPQCAGRPAGGAPGPGSRLLPPALRGRGLGAPARRAGARRAGRRGRAAAWWESVCPSGLLSTRDVELLQRAQRRAANRHQPWCVVWLHIALGTDQGKLPGSSGWFPDETGLAELNW